MSGMGTMIPEPAASANKNAAPLGQSANINKVSYERIQLQGCQALSRFFTSLSPALWSTAMVRLHVACRRVLGHIHH